MKTIYVCPDSLEGIFTGVYHAWPSRRREERDKIAVAGEDTMELFSEYMNIRADEKKASAVIRMVKKYIGPEGYEDICNAAVSYDSKKADAILGTVIVATKLENSRAVMEHLSNYDVRTVFELSRNVGNEAHHFRMFIRFRELESGILFAEIDPKNDLLLLMADHFTNRFPLENWAIYDQRREKFLIHQRGKGCIVVSGEQLNVEEIRSYSEKEKRLEDMWKGFVESISIKERENKNLQRQHMPLRFRANMTEFK